LIPERLTKYKHFKSNILKKQEGNLFLILDHITDPQNFGAIIWTSMFLGVDGIISTQDASCPITPTVSKVSSGGVELSKIYTCKFLSSFLKEAKASDEKWKIFGTDLDVNEINDDKQ